LQRLGKTKNCRREVSRETQRGISGEADGPTGNGGKEQNSGGYFGNEQTKKTSPANYKKKNESVGLGIGPHREKKGSFRGC